MAKICVDPCTGVIQYGKWCFPETEDRWFALSPTYYLKVRKEISNENFLKFMGFNGRYWNDKILYKRLKEIKAGQNFWKSVTKYNE